LHDSAVILNATTSEISKISDLIDQLQDLVQQLQNVRRYI